MDRGFILFTGLLLVTIGVLFHYQSKFRDEVEQSRETIREVEENGIILNDLRNRWSNKKSEKRIARYLKKFRPAPKIRTRGNRVIYQFEKLDKRKFEQLSKKVLQSTTKIAKFEVIKIDDTTLKFRLEIEK